MSEQSITKSPLLNWGCAIVLLGMGLILFINYRAENFEYLRSHSPNGQVEVSIQVTHPSEESRDIHVLVERPGAKAVEVMLAKNVSGGGDDEVLWSSDGRHFLMVSGMTVANEGSPGLELTDGRRIYLLYDLTSNKGWTNPALGSPTVLVDEHLAVKWSPNIESLFPRPTPSASPTPVEQAKPVATPTP